MNLGTIPGSYQSPLELNHLHLTDKDKANLVSIGRSLGKSLAESYRVGIRLPATIRKAKAWTLEVKTPLGQGSTPLEVRYPRELAPCEPR